MYTCRLRCAVEANPDPDLYLDLDFDPDYLDPDSIKIPVLIQICSRFCGELIVLIWGMSHMWFLFSSNLYLQVKVWFSDPSRSQSQSHHDWKCCLHLKVISIHSILLCSLIFNANYVTYPSCNGGAPEYRPAVNLIYSSHSQRHT